MIVEKKYHWFRLHVHFARPDISEEMQEFSKAYSPVMIQIKFIKKLSYYLKQK